MHKNIKRAAGGILVGVAVVAGGAWYVASGNIASATQKLIENANAKPHADGSTVKITYDNIGRTMFPKVGVRLVNPAIEVNSPGIAVNAANPTAAPAQPQTPFHAVWKHTGTVEVVTDYFAHEYRIVNDGSGAGSLDSGEDKIALSSNGTHSEFALAAKDNTGFMQWQKLNLSDEAALKQALVQIGGAHFKSGALSISDAASNAVIMSQDEATFDLTNRSQDQRIDFDVALHSKGAQVTKEYSDIVSHALNILHLPVGNLLDNTMPFAASRAGKQDMDIAISANLPLVQGQPTPNGDIHVSKFRIKNDFYTLTLPTDLALHEDAARRHAAIKLDWTLDVTPTGANEMQNVLNQGLPMAPMFLGGAGKGVDQVQLKQKILAALPTMSTLGPVNLVLDVDASVPKAGAPANASGTADSKESLTLHQFSFGHKRWGIAAKGEAFRDNTMQGANINGTLSCKQCTTLTQDVFTTIQQAQEATAMMQPGTPPFPMNEAILTQLNSTLGEIGKPGAATGDLDFVVTTPKPDDVRVNDHPLAEIVPKLMMVFMPQQAAPAAPVAPTPAAPKAPAGAPGAI